MTVPSSLQTLLDQGAQDAQALIDVLCASAAQPRPDGATLDGLYATAMGALSRRQFEDAAAAFSVLLALCPEASRSYAGLAHAKRGLGLLEEASTFFALAIHLDGANLALRVPLAEVLFAMGRQVHAWALLEQLRVLTLDMADHAALHERAKALQQLFGNAR